MGYDLYADEWTLVTKGDNPTGWAAFVRTYKEKYPDAIIDYKTLMQKYIKGEPV